MIGGRDIERVKRLDPAEWQYQVRLHDRTWLSRPERMEGEATGNAPAFSPIIGDCWSFEDAESAKRAAISHGADEESFTVIPSPRDPGAWLARSLPPAMAELAARLRADANPDEA